MRRAQLFVPAEPARSSTPGRVAPSGAAGIIDEMRVGVLDVGSNTARLLVADVGHDCNVVPVATESIHLGLGAEIAESGTLRSKTIATTADVCRRYAKRAVRAAGHPDRDHRHRPRPEGAAASSFVARLSNETRLPVQILSADEEGDLPTAGRSHVSIARRGASSGWSTSVADRPRS